MLTLTEDHIYLLDGQPFNGPSTTEVIKQSGMMGWLPEDQYFLDRGSFVHEAIAMYLKGVLDESTLADGVKPFVESAILWIQASGYKAEHIELSLHDPILGYCGTPDSIPLIDWKNSGKCAWQGIQLSAYWNLCNVNDIKGGHQPMIIHLDGKGKMAKCHPYTMPELIAGFRVFSSALHVYQWRKHNGLLKEKLCQPQQSTE